jgi:serine/threonine-protein kinase
VIRRPRAQPFRDLRPLVPYAAAAGGGLVLGILLIALFVFPPNAAPIEGEIPSVVGFTFDEATQKLEVAGFDARLGERRPSERAPANAVIAQDPAAGEQASRGTTVTLDVSGGSQARDVPPVTGMSRDEALAALERAGFTLGEVVEEHSDAPRGAVIGTRPAAGERLPPGAEIALVMSDGPGEVKTPDVIGQNYAIARAMLEQLGLELGDVRFDSLTFRDPNTIIAQSPAAGSLVQPGTRVNVTVAGGGGGGRQ